MSFDFNNTLKGFYILNSYDTKLMLEISSKLNQLLELKGYERYTFPTIGRVEDLQKEKNFFEFKRQTFILEGNEFYIKPTSEAIAYPIIFDNKQINEFKFYLQGPVFRKESKACKKFFRHREIAFFHEAHAIVSEDNAITTLNEALQIYKEFFKILNLDYELEIRSKEDTFPGAQITYAFDSKKTKVQLGSVHLLDKNFSTVFGDTSNRRIICFGISERILGENLVNDLFAYPVIVTPLVPTIPEEYYEVLKTLKPLVKHFDYKKQTYNNFMDKIENYYKPKYIIEFGLREIAQNKLVIKTKNQKKEVNLKELQTQLKNSLNTIDVLNTYLT